MINLQDFVLYYSFKSIFHIGVNLVKGTRISASPVRIQESALTGKIDLIVTKPASRFGRNTVDSLTTIHMLKKCGAQVYFEDQNIYSLDSKGELLLTMMTSIAQEESRSVSEKVTWGRRKCFADSKVALCVVTYITHSWGGTTQFAEMATRQRKNVVNIHNSKIAASLQ